MSGRANKQAGKALERDVAHALQAKRHPADTGGAVDVHAPWLVCQCKHRQALSAAEITRLLGALPPALVRAVAFKVRLGRGQESGIVVCLPLLDFVALAERAGHVRTHAS